MTEGSFSAVEKLRRARGLLLEVAEGQECRWCRSHILLVSEEIRDLEELARLGEEAKNNPQVVGMLRKIGERAEQLGLLALLARAARNRVLRFLLRPD